MRLFVPLLLLCPLASAQDGSPGESARPTAPAILVSKGDTLGDFRVEAHPDRIDRSTPMGFAAGWAALHEQEQAIALRFQELFEKAHLSILDRFYAPDLAEKQRAIYRADVRDVSDLRCKVLEETEGPHGRQLVYVQRRWIDALERPREDRAQLMFRKEQDDRWRLVEVRYEVRPGAFERRDRTIPPVTLRRRVPDDFGEMKDTPASMFNRLKLEFRKLSWERGNAQHELFRHFFSLTSAIYGPEVEKEMRANQPAAKPRREFWFQEKEPEAGESGATRLRIMALEKAPDREAALQAGEAVFDMRKDDEGRWRVTQESLKTDPDQPAEPVTKKFGLFLMG